MPPKQNERTPLLRNGNTEQQPESQAVEFKDGDSDNPKNWSQSTKYLQVFLVFLVGNTCTMAGSIFSPGIDGMAKEFDVDNKMVLLGQTTFLCTLGIGPLILAPLGETFGRRTVFLTCLFLFTLLQIPAALAPNLATFVGVRTFAGLFGSVGVANGGGTISDMFETSGRARALGWYLLGPLLGPTVGSCIGALVLSAAGWRYMFWAMLIIAVVVSTACYFFLHETLADMILKEKKAKLEEQHPDRRYHVGGADKPMMSLVASNSTRAAKLLLTQPIIMIMSAYQALIFASMYSLYTNYSQIWSMYGFSTAQIGLAYLGPATGFLAVAVLVVPYIDKIYEGLKEKHGGGGKPEYRLPLGNIGAVLLPVSLFWFGWSVEKHLHWAIPLASTLLFGASQVSIFNTVQNYYIDSFEKNAASALAAGAFLRSIAGGIIPLLVPNMFDSIGYGWGMSVFGFISIALMPAPALFYRYGGTLREKFATE